jgi:hypothetical protein
VLGNVRVVADKLTKGATVPVPDMAIVCGEPDALSEILISAE